MADGGGWRPPRPCEAYGAEWKLCRSARHLLHHLYAFGERPACEQWRRDLAHCREWEQRRSAEARVGPVPSPSPQGPRLHPGPGAPGDSLAVREARRRGRGGSSPRGCDCPERRRWARGQGGTSSTSESRKTGKGCLRPMWQEIGEFNI